MRYIAFLVLALLFAAPAAVSAQDSALADEDTRFLQEAAVSGIFEMQASQMALQSASQEQIKEFARLILIEHEVIDADLKRLASQHDVVLQVALDGDRQGLLAELQQVTGADFDRKYTELVAVGEHEKVVALFTKTAQQSKRDDVKEFAASTVPVLQQHLDAARKLKGAAN